MKAEVQLGADANPFVRGVKIAERAISGFGVKATNTLKGIAGSALGVSIGVAGIGIALHSAASRLKGAFDFGDKLGEMSSQTGIAVRELVILEQGAKDAGLSMEALGVAVNRMQQKIVTGGKALGELGIDLARLKEMDAGKQFIAIDKAISGVADAAIRASIVKDIFGRGGASLLALFADPNFGNATAALTSQADLLEKNAATFGRISDKLAKTGVVMRGFFLGVAETVAPALERIIDRYEKFDWVGNGKKFGDSLVNGANAVTNALKGAWNLLNKVNKTFNNAADSTNTFLSGIPGLEGLARPAGFAVRNQSAIAQRWQQQGRTTDPNQFWRFEDPRNHQLFKSAPAGFGNDLREGGAFDLERWGSKMGVKGGAYNRIRSRTALANEAEREARRRDKAGEKVELGKTTTDALKAGFKEAAREIVVE